MDIEFEKIFDDENCDIFNVEDESWEGFGTNHGVKNEMGHSCTSEEDAVQSTTKISPFILGPSIEFHDGTDEDDDDDDDSEQGKNKKRRRQPAKANPDAELIAAATEENLRLLNLDPNSKEGKKQRRRIRNRMSAQLHRERKKAYISYLEGVVKELESQIFGMQTTIGALHQENSMLKRRLREESGFNFDSSIHSDSEDSEAKTPHVTFGPSYGGCGASSSRFRTITSCLTVLWMVYVVFVGGPAHLSTPISTALAPTSMMMYGDLQNMHLHATEGDHYMGPSDSPVTSTSWAVDDPWWHDVVLPSSLLDFAVSTISTAPDFQVALPMFANHAHKQPSIVSKHQALWKYQDQILQLFPDLDHQLQKFSHPRTRKRNLRSRTDERNDRSKNTENSNSLQLVSSNVLATSASRGYSWTAESGSKSMSHVLVTQGRALLDPDLAVAVPRTNRSGRTPNQPREGESAAALTAWLGQPLRGSNNEVGHNVPVALSPEAGNNILMLLPSSAVRWGKSWGDSAEQTTESLFSRKANSSGSGDDFLSGMEETWIEIGCSVFKAQIVRNITLS